VDQKRLDFDGKVVLLNFFATWCGPCMKEMPYLEQYVWRQFKDAGLLVVAVGNGHSVAEIQDFQKQSGLTFDFVADPAKDIYRKFATSYIPRSVLIGKDGRIKYQSAGFTTEELSNLIKRTQSELAE
jgi:thiol-disulfide isomerase/thioredoxin